jgi:hypothetical protein
MSGLLSKDLRVGWLPAIGWGATGLFFLLWSVLAFLRGLSLNRIDVQILNAASAGRLPLYQFVGSLFSILMGVYSLNRALREWIKWKRSERSH